MYATKNIILFALVVLNVAVLVSSSNYIIGTPVKTDLVHVDSRLPTNEIEYSVKTELLNVTSNFGVRSYVYSCTAGSAPTGSLGCIGSDNRRFSTPQNVQLTLRCPPSGSGRAIRYVYVQIEVTQPNLRCTIVAGGIGYGYVQLVATAQSTYVFNYASRFYV